ncbi:MAG: hypothetical protein CVU57_17820 [Deltaproteobacteria bacterium HGW-Deltaproteobacteria-15]|jgi:hypothetical protein|nr:MAG: hypothetical protein CVU57_17820 [Deltaproteobacteria bacterium HGW-Deltaproteobacteria-15]
MKCPKCNYISFDYNQACPKCHKDLGLEQEKLNIPAFKPEPPSLLGGLLGDQVQPDHALSGQAQADHQPRSLDEATVQLNEPFLDDSQEIDLGPDLQEEKEDLGLDGIAEEPVQGIEMRPMGGTAAEQESVPLEEPGIEGTISLADSEVFAGQEPEKEEPAAEISLDLEEITLDFDEPAEKKQEAGQADEGLEIDLGDFSLEDSGAETSQVSAGGTGEQISDRAADLIKEEKDPKSGTDEITLTLDDLQVNNETGQLEIGKFIPGISGKRGPVKTVDLNPDQTKPSGAEQEDELSLLLGDDAIEAPAASEGVESLDLENLDLELDLEGPERK